jgi:type I restriction enzyme S subunit
MRWPLVPLGQLTRVSGGSTPARVNDAYWKGDIPWVTPTDLPPPGESIIDVLDTTDLITQDGLNSCSASLLPPGTVLFSSRATIGKIGIAGVPLVTNQGFANFTPKPGVDSKYLAYTLRYFTPQIAALAGSTTFKEVNRSALRKFQIPTPPLSEQKRIVEFLDKADALWRKRTEADAIAQRVLPALFIKMFGDPVSNPMGWTIGVLGDFIAKTQYGISARADRDESNIAILRMNNIDSRGQIDLSDLKYISVDETTLAKYRLMPGDILFNRTNSKELVGKTGLWKGEREAIPASYLIRVQVKRDRVMPEFVWAYMNSRHVKQLLLEKARRAIGMANINATELRSLPVPVPDMVLQERFARHVRDIETAKQCSKLARQTLQLLVHAVIHRAFSGELTTKWREANLEKLLQECREQTLGLPESQSESGPARDRAMRARSC